MTHKDLPRRRLAALCCSCMFTGSSILMGPATCLGAIAADLGLESEAQKGLFLSASIWGLGVLMMPSGWLADHLPGPGRTGILLWNCSPVRRSARPRARGRAGRAHSPVDDRSAANFSATGREYFFFQHHRNGAI